MRDWQERHSFDKLQWGRGPWTSEPDYAKWTDQATGYPCLIARSKQSGALKGFVGVSQGHPAHGQDKDSIPLDTNRFTLGVSDAGEAPDTELDVDQDRWWVGFDCGRFKVDHTPAPQYSPTTLPDTQYKDIHFVKQQVTFLAAELRKMADDQVQVSKPDQDSSQETELEPVSGLQVPKGQGLSSLGVHDEDRHNLGPAGDPNLEPDIMPHDAGAATSEKLKEEDRRNNPNAPKAPVPAS